MFDKASTPFWKMFLSEKQMLDAKKINQKSSILKCTKIYGNPTNASLYKVAVNLPYEKNASNLSRCANSLHNNLFICSYHGNDW